MREYYSEEYQDADGNRGMKVYNLEFDEDDIPLLKDEISKQLQEDYYDYNETITIWVMSDLKDEEIPVELEISEYLTKREYDSLVHI